MNRPDRSAPPWWQTFVDAIDQLPLPLQANRLAGLALILAGRREWKAARGMALRAWRQAREIGAGESDETVRRALTAVTPGYHAQISTDTTRIATWAAALADVVQPGMLVLEVGAGSGILAMLAARAGAQVVSCERNPVMAALATETIRRNGLAERVHVVGKSAAALRMPHDLPRPADLLMLDLFSDNLFEFEPFPAIAAARRLLRPGAVVMPARVSLDGALAHFRRWHRMVPAQAAGLDLSALAAIAQQQISLDADDPDLALLSAPASIVGATLPHDMPAQSGASDRTLVSTGGQANGVALWLRLELAAGRVLEARPGLASRGFYARPIFFALPEALDTVSGQRCSIRLRWQGRSLAVGLTPG